MATSKTPESADLVAQRLLVLQIIIGALVAGLLTIIGVMVLVVSMQGPNNGAPAPQPAPSQPIITYVAYLFAGGLIPLSVIVPSLIVASGRKRLAGKAPAPSGDVAGLVDLYQTTTIISGALREGVGHFAAVAFMIEQQAIALGLAFACVVAVAALFPTRERFERWVDDQLVRLNQEREFGT
jgi:hypothetical protein